MSEPIDARRLPKFNLGRVFAEGVPSLLERVRERQVGAFQIVLDFHPEVVQRATPSISLQVGASEGRSNGWPCRECRG